MRRLIVTAAIMTGILAIGVGLVWHQMGQQDVAVILDQLRRGKGNRQELLMQIQLARGDVATALIEAFRDRSADARFRRDVLDLLFRRYKRDVSEDIEAVLVESLTDGDDVVRAHAAYCFAAYCEDRMKLALVDLVDDPVEDVRREAYATFLEEDRAGNALWREHLTEDQRDQLVQRSRVMAAKEQDPELRFLARSVVGRQIVTMTDEATKAFQSGDLARAEQLLADALKLDPQHKGAQVRLVRQHLALEERDRALEMAEKYGGLLRIPRLSGPPVIDGDPTDEVWQRALAMEPKYHTTSSFAEKLCKGKSEAFIGHYEGHIYIAVIGHEKDLSQLVIKHKAQTRDENVWLDDCVEIVLNPEVSNEKMAYQFVINPLGAVYDALARDSSKNMNCEVGSKIFHDRGYWSTEFSIAAEKLDGARITSDAIWGLNLFRVRIGPASEHCACWPTYGDTFGYRFYPLAVFEDADAQSRP